MLIRVGYDMAFHVPEPTAMVLMLSLHPSRASTIRQPERFELKPGVAVSEFIDAFGNRCSRVFLEKPDPLQHAAFSIPRYDEGYCLMDCRLIA